MTATRILTSCLELLLMIVLTAVLLRMIYRVFVKANPDFDMEEEIADGNVAVGILMAAIMGSAALLLYRGAGASIASLRIALTSPADFALPWWQGGLLILGHLTLSLAVAVLTISFTLRFFGRMARRLNPRMHLGKLLKEGNLAVGVLLSAVVLIACAYVGEGLSSLTKALVPQPQVGKIRIMK